MLAGSPGPGQCPPQAFPESRAPGTPGPGRGAALSPGREAGASLLQTPWAWLPPEASVTCAGPFGDPEAKHSEHRRAPRFCPPLLYPWASPGLWDTLPALNPATSARSLTLTGPDAPDILAEEGIGWDSGSWVVLCPSRPSFLPGPRGRRPVFLKDSDLPAPGSPGPAHTAESSKPKLTQ